MGTTSRRGPVCEENLSCRIDDGTMCRMPSPTRGFSSNNLDEAELAVRSFHTTALNFAVSFISDDQVRQKYIEQVEKMSREFLTDVRNGKTTVSEAAAAARELREQILGVTRTKTSYLALPFAEQYKGTGPLLAQLQEKYAANLFRKSFQELAETERNQVFLEIVKASGRANSTFTVRAAKLAKLGKGLIVITAAISVYNIVTAEDKKTAVAKEGVTLGAGLLGSVAGGAAAGLLCGPGAPVCATIGAFVGGVSFALGADLGFDWLRSK